MSFCNSAAAGHQSQPNTKTKDRGPGSWYRLFNLSLLVNLGLGFYNPYFFKLLALQFLLKYIFEMAFFASDHYLL